jgi:nitrite reductase/ring-hydroxylating ferredoxin subunit
MPAVKTGDVVGAPARTGVRRFPVEVQGNDVLVELD